MYIVVVVVEEIEVILLTIHLHADLSRLTFGIDKESRHLILASPSQSFAIDRNGGIVKDLLLDWTTCIIPRSTLSSGNSRVK